MVLYADQYFLINFLMDWLSLYLAGKLLNTPMKMARLLAASAVGGLYALGCLAVSFGTVPDLLLHVLFSVLLCLIAYRVTSFFDFIKRFAMFYITCLLMGGCVNALYTLAGGMERGKRLTVVYIAAACLLVWLGWSFFGKYTARKMESGTVSFQVRCGKVWIPLVGFVDSGNRLTEPISGSRVIVVKVRALEKFLDGGLLRALKGDFSELEQGSVRIAVIPASGAGYSMLLYGFVPDEIRFLNRRTRENFLIAADYTSGDFSGCMALVPLI